MKLHVAVNADTGEIAAHRLTDGHVDDATQVPDLLRQPEGSIGSVIADGAYDGDPVYQAAAARQPGRPPDVIIPPRASAVPSTADPNKQSPRDRHIRLMAERGRMGWQRATGYGRRNLAETAIGRYKHLIGPKLRARTDDGQQGEAALAVQVLNRMIREAKPVTNSSPVTRSRQAAFPSRSGPCTNAVGQWSRFVLSVLFLGTAPDTG